MHGGLNHLIFAELEIEVRATLYACFLPCLIIQSFFEIFQKETRNSIEIFQKIIEVDEAENRRIK